jgi:hypothetical protein
MHWFRKSDVTRKRDLQRVCEMKTGRAMTQQDKLKMANLDEGEIKKILKYAYKRQYEEAVNLLTSYW